MPALLAILALSLLARRAYSRNFCDRCGGRGYDIICEFPKFILLVGIDKIDGIRHD